MQSTTIQALQARQNFGELLELAYYHNQQFTIARKNKPMARLVGETFMATLDGLIESDPGLADTLAILLHPDLKAEIEQSRQEYQDGQAVPLETVLQEL